MSQLPWMSSACRVRLLVCPIGAVRNMVASAIWLWARPIVWPASCVTVFCTSKATHPEKGPPDGQGGPSAVVNANPASFISMSASRISPVEVRAVVVVVAMAIESPSQQSYLFEQPPNLRQSSSNGTAEAHLLV